MIECRLCGQKNPEENRYCEGCGIRLRKGPMGNLFLVLTWLGLLVFGLGACGLLFLLIAGEWVSSLWMQITSFLG